MKHALTLALFSLLPGAASAEIEVSLYSGSQWAPASEVSFAGDDVIPDLSFNQDWRGRSFDWPLYAGLRVTRWSDTGFGWGLDFAHNKVEPEAGSEPPGFRTYEFTDGLNTWTLNAYKRWPQYWGDITPYVGAGLGLSVPGVEVRYGNSVTYNYQVTGPAATWLAGISAPLHGQWSAFTEYKGTYTQNEAKLTGGGTFSSDIVTHAINVGISYSF